jgi:uncharacterized FlaG/YvyC family protein
MDVESVAGVGVMPTFGASGASTGAPGAPSDQVARLAPPAEQPSAEAQKGANLHAGQSTPLADPLGKLYAPQAQQFEVSFRVEHHPNMVVTVFRDAATGQEIAQFPPELMVQLAQFFQKLAGGVVDRSA